MRPPLTSLQSTVALALGLGLLVRLAWMPSWSRLIFDGHEGLYLNAFNGDPPDPSPQAWPMLCWLYQAIGAISSDPRSLTIISGLAGASAVAGAALWAHRELGPMEGVWTAVLVALLPDHAAWSTSPYHVILPHALLIWGFVLPRWWSALCIGLACSMRPELCIVAPFAGWSGLAGLVGLAWWLALGAGLPGGSPWLALRANIGLFGFLGPVILAIALGAIKDRRCWGLFALIAVVHTSGALFTDYGTLPALLGGVALCIISATVIVRWSPVLGLISATALGYQTHQLSEVWLAPASSFAQETRLPSLPSVLGSDGKAHPELPEGCIEITEEPPIEAQRFPSHYELLAGELTADCILWGAEFWHQQWSSRGLRDRARRMAHVYQLEPIAVWQSGSRPSRVYYKVTR